MPGRDPRRPRASDLLVDDRGRLDLKSLDLPGLERWVVDTLGEKPYRARQIWKWAWQKGARDFAQMTDISKAVRERLSEVAYLPWLETSTEQLSADGTRKVLWRLEDGRTIESVLIPDGDRLTLCMSSQVGCAMGCRFCLTGDLGLERHLKPSEIANQPLQVGRSLPEGVRITNLVLMGMGEPLHNLDALCTALSAVLDDNALNYSHRKVTVSTVGLVPKLAELARRTPVNLAVSLNATTQGLRREIMPISRRFSLDELIEACRAFPLPPGKRITFEYVMFAGLNDGLDDAARLFRLLHGIKAKVNLIPYNENPDRDYRRPSDEVVQAFQHYFVSRGLSCSVRTTRGTDISAACGQLGKAHRSPTGR